MSVSNRNAVKIATRFVVLGLVLVLAACKVDATVTVEVTGDGTGQVSVVVDADTTAVTALGSLEEQLRTADLVAAGWTVDGPIIEGGGSHVITATKPFDHPDRLAPVLDEVFGPTAISDVHLVRDREFAKTTWRLSGKIDLSGGLQLLTDSDLAEALDGLPFARTDAELMELAGCADSSCDPADAFVLTMVATMPVEEEAVPGDSLIPQPDHKWVVVLGDPRPVRFFADGVLKDTTPHVWRTVSGIAGGLLIAVLVFQVLRLLVARRRSDPSTTRRSNSNVVPATVRQAARPSDSTSEQRLRLVVIGGIGVVWDAGNDPEGLLVPFVREQGGVVDPNEVADRYRAASLGQLSSAEFWDSVGVSGDPVDLDAHYLSRVRMRSDVLPFLDRMDEQSLPVACLTNAVLPWTLQLRQRFGLENRVNPWVVSGEIGARKPSQAMFEALRRMSGEEFSDMLLIDSEPTTLEAARGLGISTVLLRGSALLPEGFSHPVIDGFAGLFRSRRLEDE